jgi:hypothetical protein
MKNKQKKEYNVRRLTTLQQIVNQAREDGMDLRDLAVDDDDVFSLDELDDDLDQNPDDDE